MMTITCCPVLYVLFERVLRVYESHIITTDSQTQVRIYWDDIEAEMCRATSATLAAVMGWDDGETMSGISKSQCDLECDVARELLKCLHLVWPISQRLSRSRIVRCCFRNLFSL